MHMANILSVVIPVFSTMSRALMRDIRSAPMGLGAWGHGMRMFQPFVVTDYAVKASDAWEEVWCPRNKSKESHQQPPASIISILSRGLFRVFHQTVLCQKPAVFKCRIMCIVSETSPFAIWASVGHRARVRTHAWRFVDSTSLGHKKQACLSIPLSLANTYFHLYQYHMLYDFIQFPPVWSLISFSTA